MSFDRFQRPNSYSTDYASYGGGVPVWRHKPSGFRLVGAKLTSTFLRGEVLHEGSPVYYDPETRTGKILKCFKVTAVSTSGTNTVITMANNATSPTLNVGMNVMVAPSNLSGTGKAVAITSVDTSVENYYTITVPTASIDAVTVGSYIVEAAGAGSAKAMYCQPNNLLVDDLSIGDYNTLDIAHKSECSIYRNLMPDIPDVVLSNIKSENPLIEFEYYNEGA